MEKKILIVDDDANVQRIISSALVVQGFSPIIEGTGTGCLHSFEAQKPDLLLLDIVIPELSGFEVLQKLNERKDGHQAPIILMSAIYKEDERFRKAKAEYGVQDFIEKPFVLDNLLSTVDICLNENRESEEERARDLIEGTTELINLPAGQEIEIQTGEFCYFDREDIKDQVQEALKWMETKDYFQILGVGQCSLSEDITQAYIKKAKIFHPDNFRKCNDQQVLQKLQKITELFQKAYTTLKDKQKRVQYKEDLTRAGNITNYGTPLCSRDAELLFNQGKELFDKRKFNQAEALLREAIKRAPGESGYRAFLAWCVLSQSGINNRAVRLKVKKYLKQTLGMNNRCPYCHYFLGMVYKAEGKENFAEKCFQQSLAMDPGFIDAQRELGILALRKIQDGEQKQSSEKRGLLKKMFFNPAF